MQQDKFPFPINLPSVQNIGVIRASCLSRSALWRERRSLGLQCRCSPLVVLEQLLSQPALSLRECLFMIRLDADRSFDSSLHVSRSTLRSAGQECSPTLLSGFELGCGLPRLLLCGLLLCFCLLLCDRADVLRVVSNGSLLGRFQCVAR